MREVEPRNLVDRWWERAVWRVLARSDKLIGIRAARTLASLLLRFGARSTRGYAKAAFRVAARRLWHRAPRLEKLPERWWQTDPIVRARRRGIRIDLDLRDNLQRTVFYTGTYEPQVASLLRRELRPDAVFVDVGAHIGIHALTVARHLRRLGGGRVFAFEPTPDSAARLRATAADNGLDLTVVESALGAEHGTVELFSDDVYHPADAGVRSQYGTGPPVGPAPVVPFDAWATEVGLNRLDAVKIDVEGAEQLVIEGMCAALTDLRPRLLIIEMKDALMARAGSDRAQLRARLDSLGYRSRGTALFGNEVFAPR